MLTLGASNENVSDNGEQTDPYSSDSFEEISPRKELSERCESEEDIYCDDFEEEETYSDDDFEEVNTPSHTTEGEPSDSGDIKREGQYETLGGPLDEVTMFDAWCEKVKQKLNKKRVRHSHTIEEPRLVPCVGVDHLIQKIHRLNNHGQNNKNCRSKRPLVSISSGLLDRVRVRHLTASSSWITDCNEKTILEQPKDSQIKSLSTFCSIKHATLEGRLATTRLPDMLARWSTNVNDPQSKSVATLEYMQEMTRAQRRVLVDYEGKSNESRKYLFHAFRAQTTSYTRTMVEASLVVQDSRQLYNKAQRTLHGTRSAAYT